VCPAFLGFDATGRPVAKDSFYTKNAGCNPASDRIFVENDQRPEMVFSSTYNLVRGLNSGVSGFKAPVYPHVDTQVAKTSKMVAQKSLALEKFTRNKYSTMGGMRRGYK
jgi:hypothetical protein